MGHSTGRAVWLVLGLVALGTGCGGGGGSGQPKKGLTGSPAPGGTGAFGIITIAGHQKMYLPQPNSFSATGNAIIAVVDVGLRGQRRPGSAGVAHDHRSGHARLRHGHRGR